MPNDDAIFRKHLSQAGGHDGLQAFHAVGERLGYEHVVESVNNKAAKAIGLEKIMRRRKNVVAITARRWFQAQRILRSQNAESNASFALVEKQANANLALLRENTCAKVCAFA